MLRLPGIFFLLLILGTSPARTQEHPEHHAPGMETGPAEPSTPAMPGMVSPAVPMSRDGSGTSWHPDDSPLMAVHGGSGRWDYMVHYNAFLRYTAQDIFESGDRGDRQFNAPNWAMGMLRRRLSGKDQITFRAMMSLDRLTVGGSGYPLLFQTGETWQGVPLVDRQHPHDLFSELGVVYSRLTGRSSSLFLYFGLPGEPALGPPAYMHRPSAQENPDAPLGHHWQDATHITFGVTTLGWTYRDFKLDGSLFNGREPDENRYNIDRPRLNSWSGRLSWNPAASLALQVSHGFIEEPEENEPGVDVRKTMASLLWGRTSEKNLSASAFVWGMNDKSPGPMLHSFLAEYMFRNRGGAFFSRIELIEKDPEGLLLEGIIEEPVWINTNTFGFTRTLVQSRGHELELGIQGIFYAVSSALWDIYGDLPISGEVFLRVHPGISHALGKMNHSGH
ncbi:MAG: hypothetical protein ACYC9O_20845 [Candidatus Latescibacterota bacterium]